MLNSKLENRISQIQKRQSDLQEASTVNNVGWLRIVGHAYETKGECGICGVDHAKERSQEIQDLKVELKVLQNAVTHNKANVSMVRSA